MIQFPLAVLVKVKGNRNLAYLLNFGSNQVHPNHRTGEDLLQFGVGGNILNGILIGIANDIDGILLVGIVVAVVVSNLKYYGVYAIGQFHVTRGDKTVLGTSCIHLLAIHKNNQAIDIETGVVRETNIVGCLCSERHNAGINILSIHCHSRINIGMAYTGIGNNRCIVIFYRRRIVDRDIIHIVNNVCIVVGSFRMNITIGSIVGIAVIQTESIQIGYIGSNISNLDRQVLPTGSVLKLMTEHNGNGCTKVPLIAMRAFGNIDPEGEGNGIGQIKIPTVNFGRTPVHTSNRVTITSNL